VKNYRHFPSQCGSGTLPLTTQQCIRTAALLDFINEFGFVLPKWPSGMVWPAVISVAFVLGSTALGVPDFTEIDRAFDVLARAATDGLIVTLEPVALL
jgi:hypothetical protein